MKFPIKNQNLLVISLLSWLLNDAQAQNIGVGTATPLQKLDVNGKIKVADDSASPAKGTIRWNEGKSDFEGYDGNHWLSLTQSNTGNPATTAWPTGCNSGINSIGDFGMVSSSDGAAGDSVGVSVAIDRDYVVIGAPGDENDKGAAYVFHKENGNWVEQAKLTANDGAIQDFFGYSVDIFEEYIIVGSPFDDNPLPNGGSAYIFIRNGSIWTQQAKLLGSDITSLDQMGFSVAIDSTTVVIGSPTGNGLVSGSGCAYVFIRSGTTWTQQAKVFAANGTGTDNFAVSVSIYGNKIICGDNSNSNNSGAAYFFTRNGTSWTEVQIVAPTDGAGSDQFGSSVDLNRNYLIVGSRFHDIPASNAGAAYFYNYNGATFTLEKKLSPVDLSVGDNFGHSVSISDQFIVVGSPFADITSTCPGSHVNQGKTYLFKILPGGFVEDVPTAIDPYGLGQDNLGYSVGVSGDCFVSGAPNADINSRANKGKVIFGNID